LILSNRYEDGLKARRKILGDEHVDRAEHNTNSFDEPFQTFITESAWGSLWSRDTLPLRERSMLTIALLAALGNTEEIAMHIRATANTSTSPEDVIEALLHVAVYAGVPKANQAIKIAKITYQEMGIEL
jgi:4-carboxymuconolactone decarboxylase